MVLRSLTMRWETPRLERWILGTPCPHEGERRPKEWVGQDNRATWLPRQPRTPEYPLLLWYSEANPGSRVNKGCLTLRQHLQAALQIRLTGSLLATGPWISWLNSHDLWSSMKSPWKFLHRQCQGSQRPEGNCNWVLTLVPASVLPTLGPEILYPLQLSTPLQLGSSCGSLFDPPSP